MISCLSRRFSMGNQPRVRAPKAKPSFGRGDSEHVAAPLKAAHRYP